ncbi:MAG: hypothetical protein WCB19_04410 [Thermoplasmata archaeon]
MDVALLVGCAVVVSVSMLLWAGIVPSGLYPTSPVRWTFEATTCTHYGEASPSVQHAFPLWATVHVRWTSEGGNVLYSVNNLAYDRASTPIFQFGISGGGSFVSDATPYAFWVIAVPNGSQCALVDVMTTVTYTL